MNLSAERTQFFAEPIDPRSVARCVCLPKLPAHRKRESESLACPSQALYAREHKVEVVLQQMLEKASRDCQAQVLAGVLPPALNKGPDRLGLRLNELFDGNDRLPTRVFL